MNFMHFRASSTDFTQGKNSRTMNSSSGVASSVPAGATLSALLLLA
eukprot:CAMPEP_0114305454 /NCGR_PEP_ID=MMETSP0059-20121206/16351_1 /TAXON_ID=36894 /ORGANISM="Pyramimonas parkeae, Strain CCMP726" /LENGTH=45 /DNA_ID= /DNA_START= /DNA_END= /DNA_ORIENTATION=